MSFGRSSLPEPLNEQLRSYAPGSKDRQKLEEACKKFRSQVIDIPCVVNGVEIRTGDVKKQVAPSDHQHVLATFHQADKATIEKAIQGALDAKEKWEELSFEHRAAIFLRAADLLAHKYRYDILAATMLGQGKTVWQAEIDAAAETIDFLRFNVKYAEEIYAGQPPQNSPGVWNRVEYRPLEGFVVAISPFNFTAIGANLPTSPALMGNVVVWKPASTAVLSNWIVYQVLLESGLPPGVIQFLPGSGALIGESVFSHRYFAGLHFTGSTAVFNDILSKTVGSIQKNQYVSYPRIVGETGGKDFHFVHHSADVTNVVNQTVRGSFEYQGQKCSACSRAYIPESLWPQVKEGMSKILGELKVGQSDDFDTFVSAVIDKASFDNITKYITEAKSDPQATIVAGGTFDSSKGYFITPTIIQVTDPKHKLMQDELFGPVLTVYVYPDNQYEETLRLCDSTSNYALTGALFANDRYAVELGARRLRNAAGNFYINDKCTGAVVGQQPFGGARSSGTNDKAGANLNLIRWVSARSIKENFIPLATYTYPYQSCHQA